MNFCEVGLKISGVAPISSLAAVSVDNATLSSVAVGYTERHTVAFLGSQEGVVRKVSVEQGDQTEINNQLPPNKKIKNLQFFPGLCYTPWDCTGYKELCPSLTRPLRIQLELSPDYVGPSRQAACGSGADDVSASARHQPG